MMTARSYAPSSIPGEDQRTRPRYLLSLDITMRGDNNFYAGLSENISETGVFIATQHVLALGTLVALSFTLPGSKAPISLLGTVQWVRGPRAMAKAENIFGDHFGEVKPGIGVRFTEVDEVSTRAIRAFMRLRGPDFFE